jgi:hypothetical protein
LIGVSPSTANAGPGAAAATIENAKAASRPTLAVREKREEDTILRSNSDDLPHLDVAQSRAARSAA